MDSLPGIVASRKRVSPDEPSGDDQEALRAGHGAGDLDQAIYLELHLMMSRRHLFRYVDAEPFQPFRIKLTSGEVFEIRHPEMIAISRTTAHVFTSISDDDNGANERERVISILLIESIEPLRRAATTDQSEDWTA